MKVLFADWCQTDFCDYLARLLTPSVTVVTVKDKSEALAALSQKPDLIITQPTLLDSDLSVAIQDSTVLLWGSKQKELAGDHMYIELPVNVYAFLSVIYKLLSERQNG